MCIFFLLGSSNHLRLFSLHGLIWTTMKKHLFIVSCHCCDMCMCTSSQVMSAISYLLNENVVVKFNCKIHLCSFFCGCFCPVGEICVYVYCSLVDCIAKMDYYIYYSETGSTLCRISKCLNWMWNNVCSQVNWNQRWH